MATRMPPAMPVQMIRFCTRKESRVKKSVLGKGEHRLQDVQLLGEWGYQLQDVPPIPPPPWLRDAGCPALPAPTVQNV